MARPKGLKQSLPGLLRFYDYVRPYIKQRKWLIAGAFACLFGQTLMRLIEPWPLKYIIDRLASPEFNAAQDLQILSTLPISSYFAILAATLVIIILGRAVLTYATTVLMALAGNHIIISLRSKVFNHIQGLSTIYHQQQRSGDLVVRIISDMGLMKEIAITAAVPLIGNSLIFLCIIGVMFWLNWQLALVSLCTLPLLWFVTLNKSKKIHKVARKNRQREGVMAATASESIHSIKSVQALTLEDRFSNIFSEANSKSLKEGVQGKRLAASLQRNVEILMAISTALVLWYGALLVIKEQLSLGELLVFTYYLRRVFRPIRDFTKYTARLAKASAAGERVLDILEHQKDIENLPNAVEAPSFNGNIQFRNIEFSYLDDEVTNLENITVNIPKGKKVAVIGSSGSGKSTLIALLLRLHDPQRGGVYIDGVDIREYTFESVRQQISVVMQETALFATSILNNITIGQGDVKIERVYESAKQAEIHDFIMSLPNGYDTLVGERGVTLSAGQRQRIAIARAALRQAPILILDEPTTGLDPATESQVSRALMRLANDCTALIITHRRELAEQCDYVVCMRKGKVIEQGTQAELTDKAGMYLTHFTSPETQSAQGG
ncbi:MULTISPECIES: ABC transporter ATP-binding protein [Vibrio]|uniref:ABC transporter ATP-binding protein n=1 Tax=Vibrio bivalvicida TaxID=1276888 RepID=A0A177XXG6_9VIBR|nr:MULTISPECIES: ABC transporter ATP-binding protein [Vibrio]KLN63802.1 ABC transporter ATP-binding protein [Vibrio sp. VPAP30]OAJ93271.1 ABC transporter ATP-binding protein [Vibrio bivalvicida]